MRRFETIDHLSLNVSDVRRSHDFYRDFLGLRAGSCSDLAAQMFAGSAVCMLLKGAPSPDGVHFGFREDSRTDVDAWARKAADAGVKIDVEPSEKPWGGYEVSLLDPDGYLIQIWTDSRE